MNAGLLLLESRFHNRQMLYILIIVGWLRTHVAAVAALANNTICFFSIPFHLLHFEHWNWYRFSQFVFCTPTTHYFSQVVSKLWAINFNEKSLAHRSNCAPFYYYLFKMCARTPLNTHHLRMMCGAIWEMFSTVKNDNKSTAELMNIQ